MPKISENHDDARTTDEEKNKKTVTADGGYQNQKEESTKIFWIDEERKERTTRINFSLTDSLSLEYLTRA